MTKNNVTHLYIEPAISSFDAVAVCHRPRGSGPPVVAALAADLDIARRLIGAPAAAEARDRELAAARRALAAAEATIAGFTEANGKLAAKIQQLTDIKLNLSAGESSHSSSAYPRRPRGTKAARAVQPDYRSAADIWLSGETLLRPKRAAFKKSRGRNSVLVTFDDDIVMRVSTYLDGQAGLNAAAQFCRSSRQGAPETQVDRLRRMAAGNADPMQSQWVRDTKGTWRLVEIRDCPAVVLAEFVEE